MSSEWYLQLPPVDITIAQLRKSQDFMLALQCKIGTGVPGLALSYDIADFVSARNPELSIPHDDSHLFLDPIFAL